MKVNKSLAEKAAGIGDDLDALLQQQPKDTSAPRTAPGRAMEFRGAFIEIEQKHNEEVAALKEELARAKAGKRKYPMNRLHKIPGRQRFLTEEEFKELVENLRHNEMDSPLTLVKRPDGDWDIGSGNNRYDAGEVLGWTEIDGFERDYSPEEAIEQAFFSNLLQRELTAWEKYTHFKEQYIDKGLDQAGIKAKTGLSASTISRIMSLAKLPEEALELIAKAPNKLGGQAAAALAKLTEDGKADRVIAAIRAIVEEGAEQYAAVIAAAEPQKPANSNAAKPSKPVPEKFKVGRTIFAEMIGVGKNIRISVPNEDDRAEIERGIKELIERITEARKAKS